MCDHWTLGEFVGDCLPAIGSIVLHTRPPGPAQKFTIELHDRAGRLSAMSNMLPKDWRANV